MESLGGEIINVGKPVAQAVKATKASPRQIIKSPMLMSEKGQVLVIVNNE